MRNFGFGSVPVTALLVYLFQLVPVIFTYLRADCPCNVKMFLGLTSLRLLTGSGRVGSGHGSKILTRFHLWIIAVVDYIFNNFASDFAGIMQKYLWLVVFCVSVYFCRCWSRVPWRGQYLFSFIWELGSTVLRPLALTVWMKRKWQP